MVEKHLISQYFDQLLSKGIQGETFALVGPAHSGKKAFALDLAKKILKSDRINHPDLLIFKPLGKLAQHPVEEMRRLIEEANRTPHQARHIVIIIEEAEKISTVSSNALLKTLEEPRTQVIIFLISSHPDQLLPTIRSRCKEIHFSKENSPSKSSPLAEKVIPLLINEPPLRYKEIKKVLSELITVVDTPTESTENLNSYQKTLLEKNQEGALTLKTQEKTQELFEVITHWYRDLHLLKIDPDSSLLFFPEYRKEALRASQKPLSSLESILNHVQEAAKALNRSNPLQSTLESLLFHI